MAFDAGAIQATLTLDRNPFTAGLLAAKRQVEQFTARKYEAKLGIKLDKQDVARVKADLKALAGQAVKATAEIIVKRTKFDVLLADLKRFDGKTYSANVDVDTARATADVIAFETLLSSLNDQTVRLNANTRAFGGAASDGFGEGASRFERLSGLIIAGAPIIASVLTAAVGVVGSLASAFLIAGLGAGAFALVAVPAFKQIKAAVAGGQAEINKLPDGLRQAANGLKQLEDAYNKLVTANQKLVAISMSAWFNAGTAALKTLTPLIQAAANAFGDVGLRAIVFFEGRWWKDFVRFLTTNMIPVVSKLGSTFFTLIMIVGDLVQAFWNLGGSQILDMIVAGLAEFEIYVSRIGQNKTFQAFMDSAVRSLPVVGHLLGDLLVFILKLAVGLEPLGTLIIRVLNGIFDAINSLPPGVIGAIALAIGAVWAAIALGATGPVGVAIGVLAGLVAIFTNLSTTSDTFRTKIDDLVETLKAKFIPIWDTIVENFNTKIKPAWDDLVKVVQDKLIPALQRFGTIFMEEVWPKIQPFVDEITGTLIPAALRFLGALINIISWLVDVFGPTIASEIGDMITVFQGGFDIVAGALDVFTGIFTGDWNTFTQGIQTITRGFWTIVAGMFGTNFEGLKAQVQEWDRWIDSTWHAFWDGITRFFSAVWQTIRDIFGAAADLLRGDTEKAADRIGQAWHRVANLFRDPINWVINVVINDGILRGWNTVMGWIGAPGLSAGPLPNIPQFAQGGRVRGPGTGTSDDVLARVSNGEYVVPERITKKVWPFLEALRAGQTEALQAVGAFLGRGIQIPEYAGGGVVAGQQFAQSQHGPYVWGGVGPGGYDCSGFQSAIANVVLGQFPYRRRFATASFAGGGGAGGFVPGLNSAYGIGVVQGNPGHMAGTLGGLNVESSGGVGPHTGGGARGATNPMFPQHFSLPQVGGAFIDAGPGGAAPVSWWSIIADKVISLFKSIFGGDIPGAGGVIGEAMNNIPRLLVDKVIEAIKKKLEALMTVILSTPALDAAGGSNTSLGFGTADGGAVIPPGASTLFNATGKPEPLTNLDVYERMKPAGLTVEDVLAIINAHGGNGGGDTYNVMLPERASVQELANSLDFKRRVVAKGKYVR